MKTNPSPIEPLESRIAPAMFIVVNNTGAGSLRAALLLADNHPGTFTPA